MISIDSFNPAVKLEVQTQKASDILSKLQQSGVFKAVVIQRNDQQVVLDTAFGRISGRSAVNLQKGDQIVARILPGKSEPAIKVEQLTPGIVVLPKNSLSKLNRLGITLPVIAQVIAGPGRMNTLKIAHHFLKMPQTEAFQHGQRVMLDANSKHELVIKNLHPQSILKAALSRLIPENLQNASTHNLTSLQKLASEILSLNTQPLPARFTLQADKAKANASTPGSDKQLKESKAESTPVTRSASRPADNIKAIIEQLALPLAQIQTIRPGIIQQIMMLLAVLKPTLSQQSSGNITTLPESLLALLKELNTSPDKFERMIRQLLRADAGRHNESMPERSMQTLTNSMRNELLMQTEQSLNQILTQKATLSLQQEQHQPLQLSMNIPLKVEDEVRNLKLKISEKDKHGEDNEQSWEIDLTFNFAQLGLISTHILLQKNCLSAHFKAEQENTWALIDQHMQEFKSQIISSGFEAGIFDCHHGTIEEVDEKPPLRGGENFVDIKV